MPEAANTQVPSDPFAASALPQGWILPDRERWDDERYRHHSDSSGGLEQRSADLDGDGTKDRALFLCRTDSVHPDSSYAVLIQWGAGGDTLLGVFSWAEAQGSIGMGLVLEPPGELHHLGPEEGPDLPTPLVLVDPALTLLVFEKSAVTWSWRGGKCRRVWTGD